MKLNSQKDLRNELTALNDWLLREYNILHTRWIATDNYDTAPFHALRAEWEQKHKALMNAWDTGGTYDSTEDT